MIKNISKNSVRLRKHARVRAKISGTSECPRLCVFRSNRHIEVQVIDDVKRITLASSGSVKLKLTDGNNINGAMKVGEDIAKQCLALGIEKVVFDRGGYIYHGRVKALAEAARENGLKF